MRDVPLSLSGDKERNESPTTLHTRGPHNPLTTTHTTHTHTHSHTSNALSKELRARLGAIEAKLECGDAHEEVRVLESLCRGV
jgi:hypothetical protein